MKVAYLFSSYRGEAAGRVAKGEDHGNGFWGMFKLPHFGIESAYLEPEQFYPKRVSEWIRRTFGVYWLHLSVFFAFFAYDYVFTSTAYGTQLVYTLLRFRKPKWVMHDFSITGLMGEEKALRQRMFAWMTGRCAGIVTLSLKEKERLEKRFPRLRGRIEFIPFGVDLEFFKPMDVQQDGKIFAVGFDPDRDWGTLFKAVEGLEARVVVATRPQRVAKLTVPKNVTIAQFTPRELAKEYARSLAIIIPMDTSKGVNDAMGCSTLFEGMASGKPVIASCTHTMAAYVASGENGLLVPERDPAALREAISRVMNDAELREKLGASARAYALEHLDAEKLGKRLADFFERLSRPS
jgi:glycosyltransferase involved in cell wall biosynthesis